ncbi:MAG: glycoside hydrolase family 1 protein [Terriglobales bacterium]
MQESTSIREADVAEARSPADDLLRFPPDFFWGVSTAAHQVEGRNDNNQWSDWEAAGRIRSRDICGDACDWWNNAERDFDLAQEMGLNALRFSVEWSRIEPQGGQWHGESLLRYREMLKALVERGIEPIVCLHHFTNPRWFEQNGAFLSPDAAELFDRFARRVVEELGDLCRYWVTFNEPNVYASLGYVLGEFPPGRVGDVRAAFRVINSMSRIHALAYRSIHALQRDAMVGWAHNYIDFVPANRASPCDRWGTRLINALFNESFLGVMENGHHKFPFNLAGGNIPEAKGACDFVGLNVYSRLHVSFDLRERNQLFARVYVPSHVPQGDCGIERPYGEACPEVVRVAVERATRLGKPIYILENGVPDETDRIRPWLLLNTLREIHGLIEGGHDIRGYFHWTLTDNFEWTEGWNLRFGLCALDPATQARTMRSSGAIYRNIALGNGLSREMLKEYSQLETERDDVTRI